VCLAGIFFFFGEFLGVRLIDVGAPPSGGRGGVGREGLFE